MHVCGLRVACTWQVGVRQASVRRTGVHVERVQDARAAAGGVFKARGAGNVQTPRVQRVCCRAGRVFEARGAGNVQTAGVHNGCSRAGALFET